MKRMTTLTTFGLLAALAGASIAPAMANPWDNGNLQNNKNNARNLAIGGAAVAAYGLFSHNNVATLLGAAGAALAGSQYEKDRQDQSQDNGRYYHYNNYGYNGYNRDGYNNNGYDRNGYNHDGYNRDGYNRDGYNRDGYNRDGNNRDGNNRDGNNRYDNGSYQSDQNWNNQNQNWNDQNRDQNAQDHSWNNRNHGR
jgi:hypothetical protein